MASTLEATLTTQQLRTYYLTGNGLEEFTPPGPFLSEAAAATPISEDRTTPVQAVALAQIHGAALADARQPARKEFIHLLTSYRDKLRGMLDVERTHSDAAVSPQALRAELGKDASQFFNTEALSEALRRPASGAKQMAAARKARIEASYAALADYIQQDAKTAAIIECPMDEVLSRCGELLDRFGRVLQALEVARLESESRYEAAIHDDAIACLDWHAADSSRLAALPPVVVQTDHVSVQWWLGRLASVVEDRMPVQVLVAVPPLSRTSELRSAVFGMRQAFVLSSTMGSAHLMDGLRKMAGVLRTAVAFVSVPEASDDATARRQCGLALAARLSPLFVFDPEAGKTLAEQFFWTPVESGLSVADAAAYFPMARAFRLLPDDAPAVLPAIQTRDRRRAVYPAAVGRIEVSCHAAWRFWEELAGVGNSFVEVAVTRARQEAEATAAAKFDERLQQARGEGARNAVARLVSVLTNPHASVAGAVSVPAAVAAPVVAKAAVAPVEAKATAAVAEDPYIDSFLCTSCNDCMKINPRVFLYNADKQAYIADASAGTYAELVKAAAGCPAKCIHPGTPR